MKYFILLILITGFWVQSQGQTRDSMPVGERIKVPIFLKGMDMSIGVSKIFLYNYDENLLRFEIKEFSSPRNFSQNIFYIKKINSYNEKPEIETIEYFKINNNSWREITTSGKEVKYRNLIVIDEIVSRDTFLMFNPETYEDVYSIVEYTNCK